MGNIEGFGGSGGFGARMGWIGVLKAGEDEGIGLDSRGFWAVRKRGAVRPPMGTLGPSIVVVSNVLVLS